MSAVLRCDCECHDDDMTALPDEAADWAKAGELDLCPWCVKHPEPTPPGPLDETIRAVFDPHLQHLLRPVPTLTRIAHRPGERVTFRRKQ